MSYQFQERGMLPMSKAQWVSKAYMEHILAAMGYENALAVRVSMRYGIRIGDVLRMPTAALSVRVWSFKEEKTGKRRRVVLGEDIKRRLASIAGKVYVFEHRTNQYKHRTRQAVYKDIKRVAKFYRVPHVTTHSARKVYAVEQYHKSGGDLGKVARLLNHSDEAVTMLYALADELSAYKNKCSD